MSGHETSLKTTKEYGMKYFLVILLTLTPFLLFSQQGEPRSYNMFGTTEYNAVATDSINGGDSDTLTTRTISWDTRDNRTISGAITASGYIKKLAGTNRNIKIECALRGSTGIIADWFELTTKTAADSIPYVIPISNKTNYGYNFGLALRYISVSGAAADSFLVQSVIDRK